jgi:hypothetical protein
VSSLKNSQRPHADSPDLRILKIGPKEQPFGSGYNTSIRRCTMRQTELVSASRVAILENAEVARQLLLGQAASNARRLLLRESRLRNARRQRGPRRDGFARTCA